MSIALICMSHSPLLPRAELSDDVAAEIDSAFAEIRRFAEAFDPELVVVFGPDHYNGFFYDLMPAYCLGLAARGIGDFNTTAGPLNVPRDVAIDCARSVLNQDIDLAYSLDMTVDHGIVQPLEIVFGTPTARPVLPIFVNSVAEPMAPMRRVRRMGTAVGEFLKGLDKRVLLLGSGGLSHDPPVPRLETATPEVERVLIANRNPTPEARKARQERVFAAAAEFAAGSSDLQDLNPEWDVSVLDDLASANFAAIDAYRDEDVVRLGGHSAHEIRTWVAAYAALATAGEYAVGFRYYRPIRELIAGFAVTTASGKPSPTQERNASR